MYYMSDYAVAIRTIVPIRKEPYEKGENIDELLLGMAVEVLWEDKNNYFFVETEYKYRGYVHNSDLLFKEDKVVEWKKYANTLVIGEYVDITEDPLYNSYIITSVVRGSNLINCKETKFNRTKVMLPDGQIGWIQTKYITDRMEPKFQEEESEIRESIVNTALLYLNSQFRWGGKSPLGIDSSGLISMTYLLNGIYIWRDSDFKDEYYYQITKEELKKGDLIFFPRRIAIYLGNNKFIHSSGRESTVIINSLNPEDDEYREDYEASILKFGRYIEFPK